MKTISLQQIRETLLRYTYDERADSGRERSDGTSSAPASWPGGDEPAAQQPEPFTARLKSALRRIPVLSPVFITAYRLIKMPGRIALIAKRLENLFDLVSSVSEQHSFLTSRVRVLEDIVAEANKAMQLLRIRSDSAETRQEEIDKSLFDASRLLSALHETSNDYAKQFLTRTQAIRPVINAGDNLVISQVDGFIMAFPAEEWRLATYAILIGQPEPGLFAVMQSTIREGMIVVDIGANVGTYTLLALRQIGARGMVISYEPTPRAFEILKNNVQVNAYLESGRIDLRQKAVSDRNQVKTSFFVPKNCMGHSSFYPGGELALKEVDVIEVETVSLDEDLGRDRKVDVIKIDAEGAEPEILRGMRHIIDSNHEIAIFIEFAPQHLVRANVDPRSFLAEIRSGGFDILQVMEPTGHLRAITDEELCESFSVNLMLRKTKAV